MEAVQPVQSGNSVCAVAVFFCFEGASEHMYGHIVGRNRRRRLIEALAKYNPNMQDVEAEQGRQQALK